MSDDDIPEIPKVPKSVSFEIPKTPLSDLFDDPKGLSRKDAAKNVAEKVKEFAKTSAVLSEKSDHTLRAVIHMAAFGTTAQSIARQLQIPKARVERVLESDTVKKEVYRLQTEIFEKDAHKIYLRMLPMATNVIMEIMTKKMYKESTRLDAAKYLTDRALGKPKEVVEQNTNMLADILGNLQKQAHAASDKKATAETILDAEYVHKGSTLESAESLGTKQDSLEQVLGGSPSK